MPNRVSCFHVAAGLPVVAAGPAERGQARIALLFGYDDEREARRQQDRHRRKHREPWRLSPTMRPNVTHSAAGRSKIASSSREFDSGVGFSNGCAEFTLK